MQQRQGLQCTTRALLSGQGLDARILVRGHERVVRALDGLEPHRGLLRIVVVLVRMPHLPRRFEYCQCVWLSLLPIKVPGGAASPKHAWRDQINAFTWPGQVLWAQCTPSLSSLRAPQDAAGFHVGWGWPSVSLHSAQSSSSARYARVKRTSHKLLQKLAQLTVRLCTSGLSQGLHRATHSGTQLAKVWRRASPQPVDCMATEHNLRSCPARPRWLNSRFTGYGLSINLTRLGQLAVLRLDLRARGADR